MFKKVLLGVILVALLCSFTVVGAEGVRSAACYRGTAVIDGKGDEWAGIPDLSIDQIAEGSADTVNKATAKVMWDDNNLYVYVVVSDRNINTSNEKDYFQDNIEVFIDEKNEKAAAYDSNDSQVRFTADNVVGGNLKPGFKEGVKSVIEKQSDGYVLEASMPWVEVGGIIKEGDKIGFDFQVSNSDDTGKRIGITLWGSTNAKLYKNPSGFGTLMLKGATPAAAITSGTAPAPNPKTGDAGVAVYALLGAGALITVAAGKRKSR